MASSITALATAVSSSTSLVPSVSIPVVTQVSVQVITPNNGSDASGYLGGFEYIAPGAPIAGAIWTFNGAVNFGTGVPGASETVRDIFLTSDGCSLASNCSETCLQAAVIFNDTSTLANCMALPLITDRIAAGNLSSSSESIAKSYGIGGNRSLALQVNNTLSGCFLAFCEQSIACKSNNNELNFGKGSTYIDQSQAVCSFVQQTVLGDIAGIGIYASYWLQSGIALVAWILLLIFKTLIFYFLSLVLIWYHGYTHALKIATSVQKKARERALPRLVAALVEFQKAQCYFMMAVQIAAVATVSEGRLKPTNLQQLYNNWEAVRAISISGILPITFNLLSLQYAGKSSWYLNLLSTITFAISATSLFETGNFSPKINDINTLQAQTMALPECGNHDPTIFCLFRYFEDTDLGSDAGVVIFAYSLLMLILLYIPLLQNQVSKPYQRCKMRLRQLENIGKIVLRLDKVRSILGRVSKSGYTRYLADKSIWRPDVPRWEITLRKLCGAVALKVRNDWQAIALQIFYLVAWAFYLFYFSVFMKILKLFVDNRMVSFEWSFGQIVGITVWAEPLVEYAYLELKGMRAANYRFIPPWAVASIEDSASTDDDISPEPEQYALTPMDRGRSLDERERSIARSYNSSERDESLEAREGQLRADNMAQHLL